MLKIWGLWVIGLQNYRPSNFQNDWTATGGSNPSRLADWGRGRPADFFLRPPTLTVSNFAALLSTDPKFLAFEHLNLLKKHIKNQDTSSILKVGFALSK